MTTANIAYLGPEGTYSHRATTLLFQSGHSFQPCERFETIFSKVEHDLCLFGVLPIENNTAGIVNEAIDLLIPSSLTICAEFNMPVQHALLAKQALPLEQITTLYSMTQPYYQSKQFIDRKLQHCQWIQTTSSSKALAACLDQPQSAAIGFADSGSKLGLTVLAENIQTRQDNATRFFILSKDLTYPVYRQCSEVMHSTLVFTLEDRPGSLLSVLEIFKETGINMRHIESRRTPDPRWNYYFFVTIEAQNDLESVKTALSKVRKLTPWSRFLGHYPLLV